MAKIKTPVPDENNKFKTSISIDWDVYVEVAEIGDEEDRSFSGQLNFICKEFLKSRKNKKKD
jgi:hypothetical protein